MFNHLKVGAFIFARGGSKGILRKNLCLLGQKTLLAHAIEAAQQTGIFDHIFVSTEDKEIAEVARNAGACVPFMRPFHLAEDHSPEWLAWQHAVQKLNEQKIHIDLFVSIPTTSPLREAQDIMDCVQLFAQNKADIVVTATPCSNHPAYDMVTIDENNKANLYSASSKVVANRQAVKNKVYNLTTVAYVTTPDYILKASHLFAGKVSAHIIPPERGLEIDEPIDLAFAEFLYSKKIPSNSPLPNPPISLHETWGEDFKG